MRRALTAIADCLICAGPAPQSAAQPNAAGRRRSAARLSPTRFTPKVHLLSTPDDWYAAAIGNVTLIEQSDGFVVVDSGFNAGQRRDRGSLRQVARGQADQGGARSPTGTATIRKACRRSATPIPMCESSRRAGRRPDCEVPQPTTLAIGPTRSSTARLPISPSRTRRITASCSTIPRRRPIARSGSGKRSASSIL